MPRSPEDPVVRDSQSTLWAAMRDGLILSGEVSRTSGRWHPSHLPTSEASQQWAVRVQASTPYGRQKAHGMTLSIVLPSPSEPPAPTPTSSAVRQTPCEVHVNLLRHELLNDDRKRLATHVAMRKIHEGLRELQLAEEM